MQLLSPLAYDMLMFTFVQRLAADSRNKLKEDGVNIADWLQAGQPQPYTQPAPPLPAPHTSPLSPPHGVNIADWLQAGPRRRPRRRAPCRAPHTAPRYAQYARALASQARRLCSSARRLGERPPLGVMQACKSLAGILARDTHSAPFLSFPGTGT